MVSRRVIWYNWEAASGRRVQQVLTAGESAEELVVQVVAVGEHHDAIVQSLTFGTIHSQKCYFIQGFVPGRHRNRRFGALLEPSPENARVFPGVSMLKAAIIATLLAVAIGALACAPAEPVEVTRVVEQTVEVPVTQVVEHTVEVPVTEIVEVPVTQIVEQEVTREVPVTVVVTATPLPATPTLQVTATPRPQPTPTQAPTPTRNLASTDKANLWLAIFPLDWCSPCIGVSANPAFDVLDFAELGVTVRSGVRSETFFNTENAYSEDGYIELSQVLDGHLSSVTGVSAESDRLGALRCAEHTSSTSSELIYACVWR